MGLITLNFLLISTLKIIPQISSLLTNHPLKAQPISSNAEFFSRGVLESRSTRCSRSNRITGISHAIFAAGLACQGAASSRFGASERGSELSMQRAARSAPLGAARTPSAATWRNAPGVWVNRWLSPSASVTAGVAVASSFRTDLSSAPPVYRGSSRAWRSVRASRDRGFRDENGGRNARRSVDRAPVQRVVKQYPFCPVVEVGQWKPWKGGNRCDAIAVTPWTRYIAELSVTKDHDSRERIRSFSSVSAKTEQSRVKDLREGILSFAQVK
ncbi:uncharacterized protein LOC143184122 [Calliopsis andreniformis]|uniref:uncharacterized protein LOC143184122 n=1 Tax=Calliopsis andreniformis TaxID=337506 RepID=UPI003FCEA53A